jgi:hypothetical protein
MVVVCSIKAKRRVQIEKCIQKSPATPVTGEIFGGRSVRVPCESHGAQFQECREDTLVAEFSAERGDELHRIEDLVVIAENLDASLV